jgi:hypothetical protein
VVKNLHYWCDDQVRSFAEMASIHLHDLDEYFKKKFQMFFFTIMNIFITLLENVNKSCTSAGSISLSYVFICRSVY